MVPFCYRLKLYLKPYLLSGSSCIVQDLQYATPQEMLELEYSKLPLQVTVALNSWMQEEKVAQEIMVKYPAVVFPKSLLPYPKKKIQKVLEEALRYVDDEAMVENLKSCAVFLENFIDDEEANKRNSELLKNKEWQKAVKKHSPKNTDN